MSVASADPLARQPTRPVVAVCEDDDEIRTLLAGFLSGEGLEAVTAGDVLQLDRILARRRVDLVLLDWMLPGEDGLSRCRRLSADHGPPVIMITARDADADQIAGLDTGAIAYVTKPFNAAVLMAHIRAALRRDGVRTAPATLRAGDLVIDRQRRIASRAGSALPLTASEFDLLACLAARPCRVLTRDELMAATRGREPGLFDRTIDVQVSRLRTKLRAANSDIADLVRAVRNAGYLLAAPVAPAPTLPGGP